MKRRVYRVMWNRRRKCWRITGPGGYVEYVLTKAQAVAVARQVARMNEPSQVVVHRKADNVIQTEWTYARDPERYPG